jgi:hypothetical protein
MRYMGAAGKQAKMEEQLKFVSNLIETCLASLKDANGPIALNNWPKNLQIAAALYCEKMGYTLSNPSPQKIFEGADKRGYSSAFDNLTRTDNAFMDHVNKAAIRRDVKSGAMQTDLETIRANNQAP